MFLIVKLGRCGNDQFQIHHDVKLILSVTDDLIIQLFNVAYGNLCYYLLISKEQYQSY